MSIDAITKVDLDLKSPNAIKVYASQYDSAGHVVAQLLNGGEKWEVPLGAVGFVLFKKSDNIGGYYDTTELGETAISFNSINDRSVITIALDEQAMSTAGLVRMQVSFLLNSQRLTTFNFLLQVDPSAITSSNVASKWFVNLLKMSNIIVDDTLTISGNAADAKTVGNRLGTIEEQISGFYSNKINKPLNSPDGTAGQLLRTNGDGTTIWVDEGLPTDEQTGEAVSNWLDAHPEATTTVQDHSLSIDKFIEGELGFYTPEQFGAIGDGITDDTEAINAAIAHGNVRFANEKTYVADIVTPTNGYRYIDFNGSTILGSITVKGIYDTGGINYDAVSRTTIKNGNVKYTGEHQAILVEDRIMRTVIQNMTVYSRKDGIVCGQSGSEPSDCYIDNCFINVEPGYEDSSGYGIKCVNTDNKIMNCRIYAFKICIKVRSIDIIDNVHFLYRGDFSTNWDEAICIQAENTPVISNCYFDTYKIGISLTGNGYLHLTDCSFYSYRQDTGNITGFIRCNGFYCRLFVNGFTLNNSEVQSFRFVDKTAEDDSILYSESTITGVMAIAWGKIDSNDLLRLSHLETRSIIKTDAISAFDNTQITKQGHFVTFGARLIFGKAVSANEALITNLPVPNLPAGSSIKFEFIGINTSTKAPVRLQVDSSGTLLNAWNSIAIGEAITFCISYLSRV